MPYGNRPASRGGVRQVESDLSFNAKSGRASAGCRRASFWGGGALIKAMPWQGCFVLHVDRRPPMEGDMPVGSRSFAMGKTKVRFPKVLLPFLSRELPSSHYECESNTGVDSISRTRQHE